MRAILGVFSPETAAERCRKALQIKAETIDGLFSGDDVFIDRHSAELLLAGILDGVKLINTNTIGLLFDFLFQLRLELVQPRLGDGSFKDGVLDVEQIPPASLHYPGHPFFPYVVRQYRKHRFSPSICLLMSEKMTFSTITGRKISATLSQAHAIHAAGIVLLLQALTGARDVRIAQDSRDHTGSNIPNPAEFLAPSPQ
jgi:hypothetical protein